MTSRWVPAALRSAPGDLLNTEPNISSPDDFYQEVVDMHRGLSEQQSVLVNAKLILLLANHIGDLEVLRHAMRAARDDVVPEVAPDLEKGGASAVKPHDLE